MIICKFGGSSVVNESTANNIKTILHSNTNRRISVFSALGKNKQYSKKTTDELYECFFIYQQDKQKSKSLLNNVLKKYKTLANTLKVKINLHKEFLYIYSQFNSNKMTKEYLVSRGEYLCALIFSKFLGFEFLDASNYIIFNKNGELNFKETKKRLKSLDLSKQYCIGGFYGATKKGEIKTFPRGGSDITGSIIAKALNCEIYENYTDVNGVYDKNPNIFSSASPLPFLNYKTAYQMAEFGNEVVHKSALNYLKDSNTVLIVKNTFNYLILGTILVSTDVLFDDIYVCLANIYLLKTKVLPFKILERIKQISEIQKIIYSNGEYYIVLRKLYVDKEKILSLYSEFNFCPAYMFTIFSNNILNKKSIKNIGKLQKKLKNMQILSKFISFKNNFVIISPKEHYNKIILALNKYLQK